MSAFWPTWLGSSSTNPAGTYVAGSVGTGWDASINSNVLRQTYINGFLDVFTTATFRYDVSINGNLFIAPGKRSYFGGDVSLANRLFVLEDTSLNGRLFVGQDISLNGRLFVGQDMSLNGRLFVGQDISLNGNLRINGNSIINGDISLNGNIVVYGNLRVQQVQNANIINTTVNNYQLVITDDISLNGRLLVSQDASFGGNVIINPAGTATTGRLGIGTTSPAHTLDVNGNGHFTTGLNVSNGGLIINGTSTPGTTSVSTNLALFPPSGSPGIQSSLIMGGTFYNQFDDRFTRVTSHIKSGFWNTANSWGAEFLSFSVGNNGSPNDGTSTIERMRISGNGSVGIGTTTPAGILHIHEATGNTGSVTSGSITITHGNTGGSSSIIFPSKNNSGSDYGYIVYQDDSAQNGSGESARFMIGTENDAGTDHLILQKSGGYVGIGTMTPAYTLQVNGQAAATSFNATSDYRIKDNVKPLDESFTIDNIKPVSFTNKLLKRQDIGMIAHEVQEEYPYLVTGEKDGEDNQTVNYTGFIGLLIHEVKQLKEQMKQMQAEIEIMKANQ